MAYFRKIQLVLVALLVTATGYVYADDCAAESCCQESCGQFFIDVDFLYLRTYEGGLTSVCDSTRIVDSEEDGILVSRLTGKSHDFDFKWNPGFRLGAGYHFGDGGCGIGVFWTHLNSHTHGNKKHRNNRDWKFNYDVVDVLVECEYDLSTCVSLKPFVGLKFANIDQNIRTNFVSTIHDISGSASFLSSSQSNSWNSSWSNSGVDGNTFSTGHLKEDFSGIGPMIGIAGDWGVGCGFSVYGVIAVSTLYGRFDVKSDHTSTFLNGRNFDHLRTDREAYVTVVDTGFGVRWKTCFCDDKYFVMQLGLEQHRYFNFNQFCGYGDLSLDGFSLGLGLIY